jgi:hypothetical protein
MAKSQLIFLLYKVNIEIPLHKGTFKNEIKSYKDNLKINNIIGKMKVKKDLQAIVILIFLSPM